MMTNHDKLAESIEANDFVQLLSAHNCDFMF